MIKKLLLFGFVLGMLMPQTFAQSRRGYCGTTSDEDRALLTKRLLKNKELVKQGLVEPRTAITWVPVKFHIIADNNGNGGISEVNVFDQLCKINTEYLDQDIQFFIYDGFSYLNSTTAYNTPTSTGGQFQLNARKKNGMVNIFIPKNADTGGLGTTLGFYSPFSDWIVMRKDEVSRFNTTLVHELGHFFSLAHPHNGWDAEVYDPAVHGSPAPNVSPGGVPTEKEARTGSCKNCETAGDYLCDTPPDYNFGFGATSCNYPSNTLDPCNETVDPDEGNFMGYFLDNCQAYFSNDQKALVSADLAQRKQFGTISNSFTPDNTEPLGGTTTLQSPEDEVTIGTYNYVSFNWTDVPNADGYVFELDRSNSFNVSPVKELLEDGSSSFQATGLSKNTKYFWKVTPYNQSSTCAGTTTVSEFTTGDMESTAVQSIGSVNTWSVQPNPVSNSNHININLETNEAFSADMKLYDISGKLVKQIAQQRFTQGENIQQMDVSTLNNGMYILAINSKNGVINKRIVIAK